jgi:predicted AlkP superfamily pyrophosphatase or phosphodiesterase
LPTAITHTTYSSALFRGATIYGYKTLPEALINLSDRVLNTPKPHYFYFYYPEIDTIAHDYGASSQQVQAQIHAFLTLFESLFLNRLAGKAKNTLLVLIADHGHVDTPPEKTIYLNLAIPRIANYFMTTSQGAPIVPAGSPRDMFLYVKPDYLDELYAMLNHKLGHMARVYRTHDLINKGVFGAQQHVSQRFLQRVGNIVILPHEGESVWWYEKNRFDNSIRGHHGGLSKLEMETPFIMYDLG